MSEPDGKRPATARIGRNVRYIMRERDLTQVELAEELGLTQSQISRRINGSVDWTPEDLESLARFLRVDVETLFTLVLPSV